MEDNFKIIDKRGKREEKKEEKTSQSKNVRFEEIVIQIAAIATNYMQGKEKNLEISKHFIDLLDLLAEKTKNNLTREEESFLNTTITQLKMEFVKNAK